MKTNIILEHFKDDCQVIEFKYEYPGYVGYEQYGIITELSETELTEKYGDIIKEYVPYLLLDSTYKEARDEFRKNERKHAWRAANTIDAFNYEDGEMESHHPELIGESLEEDILAEYERNEFLRTLDCLTSKQRERIISYYFEGMNIYEIADRENTSFQAVSQSIEGAVKKLRKIFTKHLDK